MRSPEDLRLRRWAAVIWRLARPLAWPAGASGWLKYFVACVRAGGGCHFGRLKGAPPCVTARPARLLRQAPGQQSQYGVRGGPPVRRTCPVSSSCRCRENTIPAGMTAPRPEGRFAGVTLVIGASLSPRVVVWLRRAAFLPLLLKFCRSRKSCLSCIHVRTCLWCRFVLFGGEPASQFSVYDRRGWAVATVHGYRASSKEKRKIEVGAMMSSCFFGNQRVP